MENRPSTHPGNSHNGRHPSLRERQLLDGTCNIPPPPPLPQHQPSSGTTYHAKRANPELISRSNSSTLPPKRPRTGNGEQHQRRNRWSNDGVGRAEIRVAPDWSGNETTINTDHEGEDQHQRERYFGFDSTPTSSASMPPLSTPSAYRDTENEYSLAHAKWGLRREVVMGFSRCGIGHMYPWQAECLGMSGLLTGESNVVYTAPTSAGKSLVADILAIRKVVNERRKAIIVLPYIAIVQEKTRFLKKVLEKVRVAAPKRGKWDKVNLWKLLNIVGFHGGSRVRMGWRELDVAVCTIEKANALVNAAIEDRTIDQLGIVVFDELHMLDDAHRGYILELLATKLLCLAEENIQIVGMSATLSNVKVLATWLKAQFYECAFRPIPLQEHLVYDNNIYNYDGKLVTKIPSSEHKELKDPVTNAIVSLVRGAVIADHGVLVFCESRRRCEDVGKLLAKFMPAVDEEVREKRMEIVRDLATTSTGLDFTLEKTVPTGVAFHHAGLTTEERDLIAEAYDQGAIKVICCTATMAAGVNLPARRVIISPRMGRDLLSPTMLKQMRGRAGRKGRDTRGENYLCCRKEDLAPVKELLNAPMPSIQSCLGGETTGLKRALLEGIATKLATSDGSLNEYMRATLIYHTTPEPLKNLIPKILDAIECLKEMKLISEDRTHGYFHATKVGNATVASGFGPEEGVFLHDELSRALMNFNLESDMHIVYQFTPIHSSTTASVDIDWKLMREEVEKLDESGIRAATFVGVDPAFVNKMAQGGTLREDSPQNISKARVYRRFYVSLMLRELLNEKPVHIVAANYNIARGFIQQLSITCKGFATTSGTFCKVMGWTGLAVLLEHYSWRLDMGVKADLMNLARIPFVKSVTARIFHESGLKSVEAVSASNVETLAKLLELAQPKKLRLREAEMGKMRGRLEQRAGVILEASVAIYEQDCKDAAEE
ncbi:P-loop containing nucleoside triphosphate hydrolase protein [Tuber magnatum]|uniref:P-loop containing nucleoside triphosphate hydrolase protein n=1 Tax=Tuber magnatum TaxID=42249 RepID=A0A317SG81_9PEZI|nr:P-loop containing nucleoside triphosphate hydrolase protein [Tuber magnatum]